jgi:hypothetical protein
MITPEQHAEIRRLYFGEHWKVGTIAAALGVHHDTVRAAIAHDTHTVRRGTLILDPYLPFIRDTLGPRFPTHVRRPLTLLASATTVRLIAGTDEIARHVRS